MRTALALLFALLTTALSAAQTTPAEAAAQMGRGINIGNTMEPPTEGAWNNGPVQESYFDDYVQTGFSTVRIPVRWDQHMGRTAPFTIDAAWLARVEQVVDWGLARGLFVVINSHHDDWLKQDYSNPTLQARFDSLWSQVATRFAGKSDHLLFEMYNEPFPPMTLADTDDMNARVLPIIRRTNPTRIVLYSGASYSSLSQLIAAKVPSDPYVMGYYHSYDPYTFGLLGQGAWGSDANRSELKAAFDAASAWSSRTGVPAVLSEFGAIQSADYNSRMRFYGAFVAGALEAGIPFQAWDDGGDFRIHQRATRGWNDIKDILVGTYPDGPNGFTATLASDTLAVLRWSAPSGAATVDVQRRTGGDSFATIATVDPARTTFTDSTATEIGEYTYRVVARVDGGPDKLSVPQRVAVVPYRRAPFSGAPLAVPGTIEAEDYDVGGEGLTYHDVDDQNRGGAYRLGEGVDVSARSDGGFQLTDLRTGEWTEYTVAVAETGSYEVTAYVASPRGGGTLSITGQGVRFSTSTVTIAVPATGSLETLVPVTATLRLAGREQALRLTVEAAGLSPIAVDRIVIRNLTTGVEETPEALAFRVYPNPTRGRLVVTGGRAGQHVEVVDVLGRSVLGVELSGAEYTLDAGRLAPGVYVVRLVENGTTIARQTLTVSQ